MQPKYALITGASRGLGAAFSKLLAQENYHLLLLSKQKKGLTETDDLIKELGGKATLIPFDLRQTDLIEPLIYSIAERFKQLDLLMLNAGYLGQLRPLTHTPNDFWNDCLTTNLTANFRLLRGLDPLLHKAPQADVIFVNDEIAQQPQAFWGAYAITKAGFATMAQIYKAEKQNSSHITTHLFTPNPMSTHLRSKAFPGEDQHLLSSPDQEAKRLWENVKKSQQIKAA